MSKIILILVIVFIGFVVYLYFPFKLENRTIRVNNQDFKIEIATTPSQLSLGLGNRPNLCPNCGMLFIFPTPQILQFWMKDTLIPLDMIFIDKDHKITNIVTAPIGNLKIYNSSSEALYCLELNANRAAELKLKAGDVLDL